MSFDPSIGRWMQEDPDTYIDGPNTYQYELGNPVDLADPTGLAAGDFEHADWGTPVNRPSTMGKPYYVMLGGNDHTHYAVDDTSEFHEFSEKGGLVHQWYVRKKPSVPPPAIPANEVVPRSQIAAFKAMAEQYQKNDKWWAFGTNECEEQARGLSVYLINSKYWTDQQIAGNNLWQITFTGGTTAWGMPWSHHNVVLIKPINGNPLPPMVIDAFHYLNNSNGVTVEPYSDFLDEYPMKFDYTLPDVLDHGNPNIIPGIVPIPTDQTSGTPRV